MAKSKAKRLRNKRRFTGQFECTCGQNWTSGDLMIQECEECVNCGKKDICPTTLSLTTDIDTNGFEANIDEKYFGQFQCYKCLRTWFSAHSWLKFPQQCRKCHTWTEAHKLRQLRKPQGMNKKNDLKRPHESEMCGKCRHLGHNCKNSQNYKQMMQMFKNFSI